MTLIRKTWILSELPQLEDGQDKARENNLEKSRGRATERHLERLKRPKPRQKAQSADAGVPRNQAPNRSLHICTRVKMCCARRFTLTSNSVN